MVIFLAFWKNIQKIWPWRLNFKRRQEEETSPELSGGNWLKKNKKNSLQQCQFWDGVLCHQNNVTNKRTHRQASTQRKKSQNYRLSGCLTRFFSFLFYQIRKLKWIHHLLEFLTKNSRDFTGSTHRPSYWVPQFSARFTN